MTKVNSWLQLHAKDDKLKLRDDIRNKDGFDAIDVGWVSQMRPFIREFTNKGDVILEPFAGFGTTQIAAKLEHRKSIGIEIEANRIKLIKQRWQDCGFDINELNLKHGDCVSVLHELNWSEEKPRIDVCITSVPYFNASWQGMGGSQQLYAKTNYDDYLDTFKRLCFELRSIIKPNGYLVFMAENLRANDGTLLPLAWDMGKILARYFSLFDERIIVYDKPSIIANRPNEHTNRSHEYALIAKNTTPPICVNDGLTFLTQLKAKGHRFLLFGSFCELLKGQVTQANDIDILVSDDQTDKIQLVDDLIHDGFDIYCNGQLIKQPSTQSRHYRCINTSPVRQLDIVFIEDSEYNKIATDKNDIPLRECIPDKAIFLDENWFVTDKVIK